MFSKNRHWIDCLLEANNCQLIAKGTNPRADEDVYLKITLIFPDGQEKVLFNGIDKELLEKEINEWKKGLR